MKVGKYRDDEMHCIVCFKQGVDLHHLTTRGSGGTDDEWNLMPLCRFDHAKTHSLGLKQMSQVSENVEMWLIKHGWEFDEFRDKWARYV